MSEKSLTIEAPEELVGSLASEHIWWWFIRKLVKDRSFTEAIHHVAWRAYKKGLEAGREEFSACTGNCNQGRNCTCTSSKP